MQAFFIKPFEESVYSHYQKNYAITEHLRLVALIKGVEVEVTKRLFGILIKRENTLS